MDSILGISKTESKCTGCGACVSVCPKGAIRLVERKGYFLFPEIDEAKCSHCGLCLKKCPATIPARGSEEPKNGFPAVYGVYAKDEELRMASSSGGAFSILAETILAQGGAVCGAAFTSGCKLEHVIIEKREDLDKLRRSKYVQSNPGSVYRQVKSLLDAGRKVLFVGTPCQVAAMKAVAGDQENLLTADFFCHGLPPQKLFEAHVNLITGGRASEVTDIRFRDKRGHGWTPLHMSFKWSAGKYESRCIDDAYFRGFNFNMTIRRSCGNCRFSRIPRLGDFTLGDLWKVAPQELHILDNKGVSALCVNNERAKTVFESVKDRFAVVLPVPLESVHRTNLVKFHSYRHPHSWRFWNWLENGGDVARLHEKIRECLDADDGIAILNFHDSRCNYGSVLAGYALQEKIKELAGFSPVHICLWDGFRHEISDLRDFTKEHIVETKPCVNAQKLRSLNRHFRTFIVGPDVVWRNAGYFGDFYKFMFNFVFFSKNICSYAASFMSPFLTGWSRIQNKTVDLTESEIVERKRLLKRFSHVSVREDFGVEMCRRHFDVAAEQVLDSVFLLSASHYEKLLGEAERQFPSRGKAVYMLSPSAVPSDVLQELKRDPTVEFFEAGR